VALIGGDSALVRINEHEREREREREVMIFFHFGAENQLIADDRCKTFDFQNLQQRMTTKYELST
jgi:hypothetical protein